MLQVLLDILAGLWETSGLCGLVDDPWKLAMICVSFLMMYLAIVKEFEPLLLLPIAFGMFLSNLPTVLSEDMIFHAEFWNEPQSAEWFWKVLHDGGLLDKLYLGVKLQIYPCLIFLGIGTMTDFGPLIANPKSFLLGAAAQGGIFFTFLAASLMGMTAAECGSIAIIGGADGPTSIYVSSKLLENVDSNLSTGTIALAAYTYMALVPVIQPPVMKALTTQEEKLRRMKSLRKVSKLERIFFPIVTCMVIILVAPDAASLIAMLCLGNLFRESGVVGRLYNTAQNELMNIMVIFLGTSVGCTMSAEVFLTPKVLGVFVLGCCAFAIATAFGVILAKFMNLFLKEKLNPLIGAAGVSAVPMAARVAQKVGQEYDKRNYLL
ncbi:MAG: sodium ion-translocating decarboxylase subunit beta, partial [Oscillospiraceae bacterium]|nr:sodium ion-translocating decarboxylase subunit beta [Oscillospiraceae bacterium]